MDHFANSDSHDCEALGFNASQPLLRHDAKGKHDENYPGNYNSCGEGGRSEQEQEHIVHGVTDTITYRTKNLATWEAFQITYTTVWFSADLWRMMGCLSVVALLAACMTLLLAPNPAVLKVAKFTEVSKFLNVVVGMLLGLFLKLSIQRWHHCVSGFLELLDAIRQLQMHFVGLGVPEKEAVECLRLSFASAWLLYHQLLLETESPGKDSEMMWDELKKKVAYIDRSGKSMLLDQREVDVLRTTRDPPSMIWMWVAAFIARMAQDGWVPPMASPTYGHIMNVCQAAHGGLRQVRLAVSVQAPLTYLHMLATLVHINNLLNAVTFGVVSGVVIGTALAASKWHFYTNVDASMRESTQDWQNMVVTFLYCFFGPLLYQALLLISMHLAQPFDSEDAKIPLDRLLHQLEVDLCNGRDSIDCMGFKEHCFKQPPPPELA